MKIILAVLLLICLTPMPYGYYILIRYLLAIVFTIMAYDYGKNQKTFCIICVILVMPLGREVWNIVDILVAVFLLLLLEKKQRIKINH